MEKILLIKLALSGDVGLLAAAVLSIAMRSSASRLVVVCKYEWCSLLHPICGTMTPRLAASEMTGGEVRRLRENRLTINEVDVSESEEEWPPVAVVVFEVAVVVVVVVL